MRNENSAVLWDTVEVATARRAGAVSHWQVSDIATEDDVATAAAAMARVEVALGVASERRLYFDRVPPHFAGVLELAFARATRQLRRAAWHWRVWAARRRRLRRWAWRAWMARALRPGEGALYALYRRRFEAALV